MGASVNQDLKSTTLQLGTERISKLALMSRLKLEDHEIESFGPQIDSILGHVAELQSVVVEGVEPFLSPVSKKAEGTREDRPRSNEALREGARKVGACAPQQLEGAFVVPPVL